MLPPAPPARRATDPRIRPLPRWIQVPLVLVTLSVVGLLAVLPGRHVIRRFEALEQTILDHDMARLVANVHQTFQGLEGLNQDWSTWDDAFAFMKEPTPAFEASNLGWTNLFQNSRLNLIAFMDTSGRMVWKGYRLHEAGPDLPFPAFLGNPQRVRQSPEGFKGILLTPQATLMIVARPVRDSAQRFPSRGLLVMGRRLEGAPLADLEQRVGHPLHLQILQATPDTPQRVTFEADRIHATLHLPDLAQAGALSLSVNWPREVYAQGRQAALSLTLGLAVAFVGLGGSLLAAFLWYKGVQSRLRQRLDALVQVRTAELHAAHHALEEASLCDPLTGLQNRRYVLATLPTCAAYAQRVYHEGPPDPLAAEDLIFFLLDLDHFKTLNETHGHKAGDAVLQQMGPLIRQGRRDSDTVARWAGDDFLIIAHRTQRGMAPSFAKALLETVSTHVFELPDGTPFQTTASIGWCAYPFPPQQPGALTWQGALDLADLCLYAAKRAGRNLWVGLELAPKADPETVAQRLPGGILTLLDQGLVRAVTSGPDPSQLRWHP